MVAPTVIPVVTMALKVDENDAQFMNVESGMVNNGDNSSNHGVTMTARLEPHGEVAAKIIYTLTNNNEKAVTVSAGVYGDIMIGNNDYAPLERLVHEGDTYGLKMKQSLEDGAPLFCALFGEGVTGVTPVDEYWFGFFDHNASDIPMGSCFFKRRVPACLGMGRAFKWSQRRNPNLRRTLLGGRWRL